VLRLHQQPRRQFVAGRGDCGFAEPFKVLALPPERGSAIGALADMVWCPRVTHRRDVQRCRFIFKPPQ
jgi:hypothetical protein